MTFLLKLQGHSMNLTPPNDDTAIHDIATNYYDHSSVSKIRNHMNITNTFSFKQVELAVVKKKFHQLKTKKSPGFDNIPAKIFKIAAEPLSLSLTPIINRCLSTNIFPNDMKCAEVTPVFKKKNNLMKTNYRPISVLTCLSKIQESIICDQMLCFFTDKLSEYLAAYRVGYSCEHVLIKALEDWKVALDNNEHVGILLMDLSKAFDSIPHGLLLAKLNSYGMSENACHLIKSYLSNRKQRVKIGVNRSNWRYMERGVPQGSILGPLLFNIFINDFFYFLSGKCDIYNYADDNNLAHHSKSLDVIRNTLETVGNEALAWFDINMMQANPEKFQCTLLSREVVEHFEFNINGFTIKAENMVKLFGVLIDKYLTFDSHVSMLCKKASGQIKALKSLKQLLSTECKYKMYTAFILSNFGYCCLVWHMCNISNTRKIEKMQERCLRFIYDDYASTFSDLLYKSKKPSLYVSRIKKLAKLVYYVLHRETPSFMYDLFVSHDTPYDLRDNKKAELPIFQTITYGKRSLRYEGAKWFNDLPTNIKSCDNKDDFNQMLVSWTPVCVCGTCFICLCT